MVSSYTLPLADPLACLENVGGKGASLALLYAAGLPVPDGFHVTTAAYQAFVSDNDLQPFILERVKRASSAQPETLEAASQAIRDRFLQSQIPGQVAQAIRRAYSEQFAPTRPLAVRSSATAEDLPGASFAGQQETYLNICGIDALLEAVKKCWASLWTARAIAYRARQGIPAESVSLAVVVQELVCADASGVMFTANPITGKRNELMITATWGLGEAIVGGLVTPDTLILGKRNGRMIHREICAKKVMTVLTENGTREQPVPSHLQKSAVLRDEKAAELSRMGVAIERLYGIPMDIEWTLADGKFAIVQARPVTTLTEVEPLDAALEWVRPNPKEILARGSFAEFVPDPVSPLFATLAMPIAQAETQKMMSALLQAEIGSYRLEVINGYVFVGMVMTPKMIWKMLVVSMMSAKKLLGSGRARWAVVRANSRALARKWQPGPGGLGELKTLPAAELLAGACEIFRATAEYYTVGQSGPIGEAPMGELIFTKFYSALIKDKQDPPPSTFLLGFETLSLRAEKSLYDLAMWVKGQPVLAETIQRSSAQAVRAALKADPIPAPYAEAFADRFAAHLVEFGHTLYDLDFAKPVPADDPLPLIETMKAYLDGQGISPHERQRAQMERREQAEHTILRRLDPLRRKWFLKLLHWAQEAGPNRENCIADLGLGYPQLRGLLGEVGRRLAEGGAIDQPEDIYWLEAQELEGLAAALDTGEELSNLQDKIIRRKAFWRRVRKVNVPITLPKSFLSRFLAHDNPEGSTLKGYPASAGKITARACVLHGPEEFGKMRPGDIIVAVTTTPAWTPLFAMASGVVTDIGGPLSHSSIVAREYGIPAVMATGAASKRILQGQMITVDGNTGLVILQSGDSEAGTQVR